MCGTTLRAALLQCHNINLISCFLFSVYYRHAKGILCYNVPWFTIQQITTSLEKSQPILVFLNSKIALTYFAMGVRIVGRQGGSD